MIPASGAIASAAIAARPGYQYVVGILTLTAADLAAIDALIAARLPDIAAAILAAAQVTPIWADARRIKGQNIVGAGTQADPWGPE